MIYQLRYGRDEHGPFAALGINRNVKIFSCEVWMTDAHIVAHSLQISLIDAERVFYHLTNEDVTVPTQVSTEDDYVKFGEEIGKLTLEAGALREAAIQAIKLLDHKRPEAAALVLHNAVYPA